MNRFAHGGANDGLAVLASGFKAFTEGPNDRIVFPCHEGWQVERLAQGGIADCFLLRKLAVAMTFLGQTCFSRLTVRLSRSRPKPDWRGLGANRSAELTPKPHEGYYLLGALKAVMFAEQDQQVGDSRSPTLGRKSKRSRRWLRSGLALI